MPVFMPIIKKVAGGGGGAELNIAYGDIAPTDATKLWCKTSEPNRVLVTNDVEFPSADYSLDFDSVSLGTFRIGQALAVYDDKIFMFGGQSYNHSASDKYKTISYYDTKTGVHTTIGTTLPTAMYSSAVAQWDGGIYIICGVTATNSSSGGASSRIYRFDADSFAITTLSSTIPLYSHLYTYSRNPNASKAYIMDNEECIMYCFDAENENVSIVLRDFTPANFFANLRISGQGMPYDGKRYMYDTYANPTRRIDTETWETDTPYQNTPTSCNNSVLVGDYLFYSGGNDPLATTSTVIPFSFLDLVTGELTTIPAEEVKNVIGTTSVVSGFTGNTLVANGSKVYAMSGYYSGNSKMDGVAIIQLPVKELALTNGTLLIAPHEKNNRFAIINAEFAKVEMGVSYVYKGNAEGIGELVEAYIGNYAKRTTNHYDSACTEVNSNTVLTAQISCAKGDLVVAAIATRDALQISDGWTLVSTSGINSVDTTNGHRLSWAYKFAESDTESITVTQASAQRLYINMVALKGATGVVDNGYSYANASVGDITVTRPNGLVLWGLTTPTWGNTAPYSLWESSNGAPIVQIGTSTQSRLGVALDQTSADSVRFLAGASNCQGIIVGSLTVEGMDAFYTTETIAEWKLI